MTNKSNLQSYVSTFRKISQDNVPAFSNEIEGITGVIPDVRVKKANSLIGKIERYQIKNKNPQDISDVLAGRIVIKNDQI